MEGRVVDQVRGVRELLGGWRGDGGESGERPGKRGERESY